MNAMLSTFQFTFGLSSKTPLTPQTYVPKCAPNGVTEFPTADPLSGFSTVRDEYKITCAENDIASSYASLLDSNTSDDDMNFTPDGSVSEDVDADVNANKWTTMWNWWTGGTRLFNGVFMGDHKKGVLKSGDCDVGRSVEMRDAGAYVEVLVDEEAEAEAEGYSSEDSSEDMPAVIRPQFGIHKGFGRNLSSAQSIVSNSTQSVEEGMELSIHSQHGRNHYDSSSELDESLRESQSSEDDLASVVDGYSAGTRDNSYTISQLENFSGDAAQLGKDHELQMLISFDITIAPNTSNLAINNTPTLPSGHQNQNLQYLSTTTNIYTPANKTSSTVSSFGAILDTASILEPNHALASLASPRSRSQVLPSNAPRRSSPRKALAPRTFNSTVIQEVNSTVQPSAYTFPDAGHNVSDIFDDEVTIDDPMPENGKSIEINNLKLDDGAGKRKREATAEEEEEEEEEKENKEWVMVYPPDKRMKMTMDAATSAGMGMDMGHGGMVMAR
jgi:hypothetical protein